MILIILQSSLSIFIFFIANTLTNGRFMPDLLNPIYQHLPTMLHKLFVLGLPLYAVGILMLADAFNKDATVTGPSILAANILATVLTAMLLDGLSPTVKIAVAVSLCLCADVFLYYALKTA